MRVYSLLEEPVFVSDFVSDLLAGLSPFVLALAVLDSLLVVLPDPEELVVLEVLGDPAPSPDFALSTFALSTFELSTFAVPGFALLALSFL